VQQLRAVTERDKPEHKVAAPVDGRIGFRISSPPEVKFSWRKAFRRLNFSDFSRAIVTVPFIQPGAKNKKRSNKDHIWVDKRNATIAKMKKSPSFPQNPERAGA